MPNSLSAKRRDLRRRWRRLRRKIRYGRHTPLIKKVLGYGFALLVGLSLLWLVITGLLAKQALSQLQTRLVEIRALVANGQLAQARQLAEDVPVLAQRAHRLTTGPVWWTAAQVPYFGDPVEVVRGTTDAANMVGSGAVPTLIQVVNLIDPARLRVNGDTVRLGPLREAAAPLQRAADEMEAASAEVAGLPGDTWLSAIDTRRFEFAAELEQIRGYVDAAARGARVLPTMLGEHGTQRYFIGLQSEAEMRGTGGLPGAFAIATTSNGTLSFRRFGSNAVLLPPTPNHVIPTGLDFGRDYDDLYSPSLPTSTFVDSNVSPNFPYAARIWATMWERTTGQHVDGVLALDPTVLSYFLAAAGPAQLPDGTIISSSNVVALTERDQYSMFPNNVERKQFEVDVLRAASHRLTSGTGAAQNILRAASRSASEQRLLVWSADPKIEAQLAQSNYAGKLPDSAEPFSGLILNNAASGKLEYYLHRELDYQRTGCGSTRDVLVTVQLTNTAPAFGLPVYVTSGLDHLPPGSKPGDDRLLLDYYATRGALLNSVTIDNKPATASAYSVDGFAVFRIDLTVPRGTTSTIVLHLVEPAGTGPPRIWQQPGVTPMVTRVFNEPCL
jgi:hypothetical protein